jgi:hypothetical protein
MNKTFLLKAFAVVVLSVSLCLSSPLFGESTDLLSQAFDLVHQALNPGGDPPPNDQRVSLLEQAKKLAQEAPEHHVKGHRVQAILDINAALAELKMGDPNNKANGFIHDAAEELRTAMSIAD